MDGADIPAFNRNEQQHYSALSLNRAPNYRGLCDDFSPEEAQALLGELLRFFGLHHDLPVPPFGLPGHGDKPDPAIIDTIRDGVRYLRAICDGEKKTLWNIHNRIEETLRRKYWEGREYIAQQESEAFARELPAFAVVAAKRDAETFVYFIRSASGGIKIGSARDAERRMKELQTAHPVKLELLACTTGGQPVEREYHRRFSAHRLHGEWFSPHEEILAEIDRLNTLSPPALAMEPRP